MQLDAISIAQNRANQRTYVKVELNRPECGRCYLIWATRSPYDSLPMTERYWETYSDAQLNVARTRSRVIYRILKAIISDLTPEASLPEGDYLRGLRLSAETRQFEPESFHRYFGARTSAMGGFVAEVMETIANTRAYGSRPTRLTKLRAVPAKPLKFKELWKRDYHDYRIQDCESEEKTFSAMDGNFRMGVELEGMTRGRIWGDDTYMYRSEDGSIGNGSEFITRPDSAAVHVRELETFLQHNSISPDHRCGMHVHVDRRMLSEDAIRKIVDRMFDRRRREFYVKYVAGRNPNSYCSLSRDRLGQKYCAINTGRSLTIEFRWFSSTNKIRVIKRRLQWINTICKWACAKAGTPQRTTFVHEISLRERAIAEMRARFGSDTCTCSACVDAMMADLDLEPVF